jgi:hypothetical protein
MEKTSRSERAPLNQLSYAALSEEAYAAVHRKRALSDENDDKDLIDDALWHIYAYNEGEDFDPASGLLHLAYARADLAVLIESRCKNACKT